MKTNIHDIINQHPGIKVPSSYTNPLTSGSSTSSHSIVTNYDEVETGKYFKLVITFTSYLFSIWIFLNRWSWDFKKEEVSITGWITITTKKGSRIEKKISELEDQLQSVKEENTLLQNFNNFWRRKWKIG